MKKLSLSMAVLVMSMLVVSCSDDDDSSVTPEIPVEEEIEVTIPVGNNLDQLVINEFNTTADWVELHNQSDEAIDASGLVLCLGSGTYVDIDSSIVLGGELMIPAGGFLVVGYNLTEASGGLGLYVDRSGFANPDNLLDFVQYGAAGSQREVVAVEAGIWGLGDFVPSISGDSSSYAYDGSGNTSADWFEALVPTIGLENEEEVVVPIEEESQVVINEFSASGNWIELHNQTDTVVDASDYWLCLGRLTYVSISSSMVLDGVMQIPANGFLVVEYDFGAFGAVNSGGLGLYLNNTDFTNPENLLDFVQYGEAGSQRENVAVEAGIWELGDFVPGISTDSSSYAYDGMGDSSADWSEALDPTVGLENP